MKISPNITHNKQFCLWLLLNYKTNRHIQSGPNINYNAGIGVHKHGVHDQWFAITNCCLQGRVSKLLVELDGGILSVTYPRPT